ncbi:hypothetical protein G9033_004899, partial [Salmonella enterica]|nr:hypothetical protein [Salmonella enterica]EEK2974067.1 hypothetical protein [Salmonella enterica]
GGIDLTSGNISARNDIILTADNGTITIKGNNATSRAQILSSFGNISIDTKNSLSSLGLLVNNVTLMADNSVSIDSIAGTTGASIHNTNITATNGHININGSASKGEYDYSYGQVAGVQLYGDLIFKSGTGTTINAYNTSHIASYSPPVPLAMMGANLTLDGGGEINACGSFVGIMVGAAAAYRVTKSQIFVKNGDLNINTVLDGMAKRGPTGASGAAASGAFTFDNVYADAVFGIDVDSGSNVTINADSSANKSGPFAAFAAATPQATATGSHQNGFIFSGGGNISVHATSDSTDAVNLRLFNNVNLTGNLAITGESNSGIGVNFDKYLSTNVSNASITGISHTGVGVQMTAKNGNANLNHNTIFGKTETGAGGVILSGNNIIITNGSLTGNATAGIGSGVSMVGGSNYSLDGAFVTGYSVNGSGISVNGTLAVNNGTQVVGKSFG